MSLTGQSAPSVRLRSEIVKELDDRRVARTRVALLTAFREIVFANGYEKVTIREVAARANVGRSTFYDHFSGKEDLLRGSMSQFLVVFSASISSDTPPDHLVAVLDHLWSNRRLTDAIFTGTPRGILTRALAQMIEARLEGMADAEAALIPLRLASIQLADAQFALVEAWLRGKAHCPSARIASAFHASSRAAALALLSGATIEAELASRSAA
jgi:AcrR family transcriptional regulator